MDNTSLNNSIAKALASVKESDEASKRLKIAEKIQKNTKETGRTFVDVLLSEDVTLDEIGDLFNPVGLKLLGYEMGFALNLKNGKEENATDMFKNWSDYLKNIDDKDLEPWREIQLSVVGLASELVKEIVAEKDLSKKKLLFEQFRKKFAMEKIGIILPNAPDGVLIQKFESDLNKLVSIESDKVNTKKIGNVLLALFLIVVGYLTGSWFGAFIGFVAWLLLSAIYKKK
ncbi:MAG: hypothetical protein WCW64_11430 [Phycisphaerae bacterium]|jgi:hypothetical protein